MSMLLSGSLIDLDGTIFVQFIIFFLLFFILRALVFKPLIALFARREEAIEGAREEAKRLSREVRGSSDKFEEALRKVREEAGLERDRIRQETANTERDLLEKVRNDVKSTMDEATATIAKEAADARAGIRADAPRLAREIATKLLGRSVDAS